VVISQKNSFPQTNIMESQCSGLHIHMPSMPTAASYGNHQRIILTKHKQHFNKTKDIFFTTPNFPCIVQPIPKIAHNIKAFHELQLWKSQTPKNYFFPLITRDWKGSLFISTNVVNSLLNGCFQGSPSICI